MRGPSSQVTEGGIQHCVEPCVFGAAPRSHAARDARAALTAPRAGQACGSPSDTSTSRMNAHPR
jgi:hypothetical protein